MNASLRPDPHEVAASIERHSRQPEVSAEEHIRRLRLVLGESVKDRLALYLDTRYWNFLRDVLLERPQQPIHVEVLAELRRVVASGMAFCPLRKV